MAGAGAPEGPGAAGRPGPGGWGSAVGADVIAALVDMRPDEVEDLLRGSCEGGPPMARPAGPLDSPRPRGAPPADRGNAGADMDLVQEVTDAIAQLSSGLLAGAPPTPLMGRGGGSGGGAFGTASPTIGSPLRHSIGGGGAGSALRGSCDSSAWGWAGGASHSTPFGFDTAAAPAPFDVHRGGGGGSGGGGDAGGTSGSGTGSNSGANPILQVLQALSEEVEAAGRALHTVAAEYGD